MATMTKQQRGTVMMKCVECDHTISVEFELPGPQMVQPQHEPNCPSIDLEFQPRYRIWVGVPTMSGPTLQDDADRLRAEVRKFGRAMEHELRLDRFVEWLNRRFS